MDANKRRNIIKVIVVGDSGVGKTSLLIQYVKNQFDGRYKATVGAEFLTKNVEIDGNTVNVQIWDTAGQDRFRSLGSAYYRGASACVLVYDVTSSESFSHISAWLDEFNTQAGTHETILIGNKTDLEDKRAVTKRTAMAWCEKQDRDIKYFETSAKDTDSVAAAFEYVATNALRKKLAEEEGEVGALPTGTINLTKQPSNNKKKDGCPC